MKRKFFKCARGAVSLFLVVLLLPFTEIATILISAQRYNSSIGILDEVMDSSMLSTLGNYDKYVRERFGVFTPSQKKDLQSTFDGYFDYNIGGILGNSFNDGLTATVTGDLPLTDDDVLELQIKEYNKLNAPFKMINDGLDLSELMKTLEKNLNIKNLLDFSNAGADFCDAALDFNESYEKLCLLSDRINVLISTYNTRYNAFNKAIGDIYDARDQLEELKNKDKDLNDGLTALNDELEELSEKLDKAETADEKKEINDQIDELNKKIKDKEKEIKDNEGENQKVSSDLAKMRIAFGLSKTDYINCHSELISKLGTYKTEFKTALEKIESLKNSTGEVIAGTVNVLNSSGYNDAKENNKKINKELENYDDPKVFKDSRYYELVKQRQENDVVIANYDIGNAGGEALTDGNDKLSELLREASESFNETEIQNVINNLTKQEVELGEIDYEYALKHSNGSEYHTSVNVVLSREQLKNLYLYFDDESSNISTSLSDIWNALKSIVESLFKLKLVFDPALCAKIDTGFFESNYGLSINQPATNPAAQVILAVSGIITSISDAVFSLNSNFVERVKSLWNAFKCVADFVTSLGELILQIGSNIYSLITNPGGVLLPYYFMQTLPCRTDYKDGKNMTGSPYSKIAYANYGNEGVNGIPLVQDLAAMLKIAVGSKAEDDKMFCGAELEYLIVGSNDELVNQSTVFGMLYIFRMIFAAANWGKAVEFQALATGPQFPLVFILYLLFEPLIDCVLLVNGGKVDLLKSTPNLSVAGMVKIVPQIVSILPQNSETNDTLNKKFNELFEIKSDGKTNNNNNKDEKTGYLKGLLSLNYKEYVLLLMVLTSNNSLGLGMMKNLIQMETLAYNTKNSLGDFDIRKAYTQMQCDVSGSANPILATAFSDSIFKFSRTQIRGY